MLGKGGGVGRQFGQVYVVDVIMGSGHMGTPVNRQTDITENITFPQNTYADDNNNTQCNPSKFLKILFSLLTEK